MIAQSIINSILDRNKIEKDITQILKDFEHTWKFNTSKKGIFIHGPPGVGKTIFVISFLKSIGYDVIHYDSGDIRNKALFQTIDSNHISNRNVLDLMNRRQKKLAIVMDEIDGMNSGDKGGIDALIKLIRQKKTKKQKAENVSLNPILCIGNFGNDKKIRELMKACHVFELQSPNNVQMATLLKITLPPYEYAPKDVQQNILHYIQGDLRKLNFLSELWKRKPELASPEIMNHIFHVKILNEDTKKITWKLFQKTVPLQKHNVFMNETDRTTVALLWHENVPQVLSAYPIEVVLPFYCTILNNICFADYIVRITFQSQIWLFNEMTSLLKTFYNNKLLHDTFPPKNFKYENVEFTKVLTKYSTEYNNQLFLNSLCQKMNMDKKDMIACFQEIRSILGAQFFLHSERLMKVDSLLQRFQVDSLDIKRIYRFLDKNIKKEEDISDED